jgi:hypothetical protein
MDIQDETWGECRKQHWNKDPRLKEAAISEERKDIWENLRENHRIGDRKTNSLIYQTLKNEGLDIVEESASSKTEEEPTCSCSVRIVGNVGAQATVGSFAPTGWKKKKNLR